MVVDNVHGVGAGFREVDAFLKREKETLTLTPALINNITLTYERGSVQMTPACCAATSPAS